jgi:acetyl-CoA synthetase
MPNSSSEAVESLLKVEKVFYPSEDVVQKAYIKNYDNLYSKSIENIEKFWEEVARELEWFKPWEKVLEWNYPWAKWFVGAKCNIVHNALDRHVKTWRKNKVAIYWEGEPGDTRVITYSELFKLVNKFANALKDLGVRKGDRVTIYLPRIPEQIIAMLACAKIGAIHSVVYSGFSSGALRDRIRDAESKVIITSDGSNYRGRVIPLYKIVSEINECPTLNYVVVIRRACIPLECDHNQPFVIGLQPRCVYYDELMKNASVHCETEIMDSEDPLYFLYTSGTTGKPKGVVHVHGGYMVGVYITAKWIFDIKDDDVFWCTADPGWVTGHSYIVYGPLINGATILFYEGAPDFPNPGRWWSLVEKYGVSVLYSTPTAIRGLMRYGEEYPQKHDLSSLRLLGSVGEPINPEAWLWYYRNIGREKCPIMDTWWQTETGMILITPLPSTPLKPGSAAKPFPGIIANVVNASGEPLPPNKGGQLVIKTPWPAMMRTLYKDQERYVSYWNTISGWYMAGDVASKDEDGYFWIKGRADDVIKTAGYRIGTAEVESALVSHPAVAEAAVIGKPDPLKGEIIKAFIILRAGWQSSDDLKAELKKHVREVMGPIAVPSEVEVMDSLPKTRSGKIMRRVLKAKELGLPVGDTSTLEE